MKVYILRKSNRKGKRFVLEMGNNMIYHFGSAEGKTYIDGRSYKEKAAWIARHQNNRFYNDKYAGIYYSKNLLWGEHKSLQKNINDLGKKDNIIIKYIK
jgi:hypothetical protein